MTFVARCTRRFRADGRNGFCSDMCSILLTWCIFSGAQKMLQFPCGHRCQHSWPTCRALEPYSRLYLGRFAIFSRRRSRSADWEITTWLDASSRETLGSRYSIQLCQCLTRSWPQFQFEITDIFWRLKLVSLVEIRWLERQSFRWKLRFLATVFC